VLDTPEFQRLRSIKQLGFSEFSFPGATHNRYIHSLGVCHLAGKIFDSIFRAYPFAKSGKKIQLRQVCRLGALLHDLGHGPLSHTTEQVMPKLKELDLKIYQDINVKNRRANHEDYTLKILTDSPMANIIDEQFEFSPYHIACLIDKSLPDKDDFFIVGNMDFRPILSQIVSSELDADRMDYLERDSYFCGTNYGKVDIEWLIQNLTFRVLDQKLYLAIGRRALYSFDDFLISRHHMYLMVYFHHKSIIYEEMLNKYLTSKDCEFFIPADVNEYIKYNDYKLYEHLASSTNPWAQRIALRRPFKVLFEMHNIGINHRCEKIKKLIEKEDIEVIWASSYSRLSKYHTEASDDKGMDIYVVDHYDKWQKPVPINKSTEIFKQYEGTRVIDRLYVAPENYSQAEKILKDSEI
ncbi:MAG: HD domain-containing protein, partial [Bdellovibrionales bacterium]|nr:HD domain-containing protein [Bdellovibrionales bacterium]